MFKKTLVCLLFETRGSAISWPSFKKNVLDELNADLALCVGVPDGYDYTNPLWQHAKYRFTSREYENWDDALDLVQKYLLDSKRSRFSTTSDVPPDWRALADIPGTWISGAKGAMAGSAVIQLFFRWLLLESLRSENLIEKYDRFIYARSDLVWASPHPPVELLDDDRIWVPDGEHYGGVMDRYAVFSRSTIEACLNLLEWLLLDPEAVRARLIRETEYNSEAFFKIHLEHSGCKIGTFPLVTYIAREKDTRNHWAESVWNDELSHAIGYPTEYLLVSRYKNYFKSRADWQAYLNPEQHDLLLGRVLATSNGDVVHLTDGMLALKPRADVVPRRYVLRVDVVKEKLAPFFVDPDVNFAAAFPNLTDLTIGRWTGPDTTEVKVAEGRYLTVDANKSVIVSDKPTAFRLARWEELP